jgi:hypothetical protein
VSYTPRGSTAGQRRRDAALHLLESTGRLRSQLRRALSLDDGNPGGGGGMRRRVGGRRRRRRRRRRIARRLVPGRLPSGS